MKADHEGVHPPVHRRAHARWPLERAFVDEDTALPLLHAVDALEAEAQARERAAGSPEGGLRALVALLGTHGLLRHVVRRADGGSHDEVRSVALCLLRERLAYVSPLCDLAFAMQGLGTHAITLRGDAAQRARWLPEVAAGRAVAGFALTEPGAGSDLGRLACTARREGEHYVLSGRKAFISNAGVADVYTLFAVTSPDAARRRLSAFILPADTPGVGVVAQRVLGGHPIGELHLDGVRLPSSSRIGDEGEGLAIALAVLQRYRPTVGAAAVGMAQRALDETLLHTRARVQFDRPLAEQPVVAAMLADMACEVEASRLLVYRAAAAADAGAPRGELTRTGSMAKLMATEAAQRVIDRGVQLHGGRGVLLDGVLARLYEDVRSLRIYEGATEIHRALVARELLAHAADGDRP
jgi:acyl-CoA dehydrogenase